LKKSPSPVRKNARSVAIEKRAGLADGEKPRKAFNIYPFSAAQIKASMKAGAEARRVSCREDLRAPAMPHEISKPFRDRRHIGLQRIEALVPSPRLLLESVQRAPWLFHLAFSLPRADGIIDAAEPTTGQPVLPD
jgi:hypothetical protein